MKTSRHYKISAIALLILLQMTALSVHAQAPDESHLRDPAYHQFVTRFKKALAERNRDSVMALCMDSIHVDLPCDPCSREAAFSGQAQGDEPKPRGPVFADDEYTMDWEMAERLLSQGFTNFKFDSPNDIDTEELVLIAPAWIYIKWKKWKDEGALRVTGKNVNVREMPSLKGKVIYQASHEWLKCLSCVLSHGQIAHGNEAVDADGHTWVLVLTPSGARGYISMLYTSHYLYKTLGIVKHEGEWKILFFYDPST